MRTTEPLAMTVGLLLAVVGLRTFADDRPAHPRPAMAPVEASFRETVRPFLETYCCGCHGQDEPKADLDLSGFTTAEAVAKDLPRWELVLEQLGAGLMPPARAKRRPTDEARDGIVAWIEEVVGHEVGHDPVAERVVVGDHLGGPAIARSRSARVPPSPSATRSDASRSGRSRNHAHFPRCSRSRIPALTSWDRW